MPRNPRCRRAWQALLVTLISFLLLDATPALGAPAPVDTSATAATTEAVPQQAEATRELAFNQGFYNLFLAVLVAAGIALFALGHPLVGATLVLAGTGSMVAAGLVLALSSPAKRRAALVQAGPPLLAILLLGTALAGAATMAG